MLKAAYIALLQNLLPRGDAWNREPGSMMTKLLSIIAAPLAAVHERAIDLIDEADPRTAVELFDEWEVEADLPDSCTGADDTLQERRSALIQKLTGRGGQSISYFKRLAADLGYDVEITEYRPFICGISECGVGLQMQGGGLISTAITNLANIRFFWSVKVLGPRVTWFRCGESECGVDPLAKISRATDLECVLSRHKPAHTSLIFSYEGI